MAQISTITVSVWKGTLTQATFGYQLYEQGGVDGHGVLFGGRKVPVSKITTVARPAGFGSTLTDYNTAASAYRNLMRSAVTIVDQMNLVWNGVVVLSVTPRPSQDPLGFIITADWELLVQALP